MGSYIGLVKPLYFIRYIYLRFRLLYLILLTLLIKHLSLLSALTSRRGLLDNLYSLRRGTRTRVTCTGHVHRKYLHRAPGALGQNININ